MTDTSWRTHKLDVTIQLTNGDKFKSTGEDIIKLSGFRVVANVVKAGSFVSTQAHINIYGISQDDMNRITTLQFDNIARNNQNIPILQHIVTLEADGAIVFEGTITNARGNYSMMPDVFLEIEANEQAVRRLQPHESTNPQGAVNIKDVFAKFAQEMELKLESRGIDDIKVEDLHLAGTIGVQVQELAQKHNLDLFFEGPVMVVTPKGAPRDLDIIVFNKDSGLVGYPSFDNRGVSFRALFDPALKYQQIIELQSPIDRANGEWLATKIVYHLESEKPGGMWFMDVVATPPNMGANYVL